MGPCYEYNELFVITRIQGFVTEKLHLTHVLRHVHLQESMSEGRWKKNKSYVGEYEHEVICTQSLKITIKNFPEKA